MIRSRSAGSCDGPVPLSAGRRAGAGGASCGGAGAPYARAGPVAADCCLRFALSRLSVVSNVASDMPSPCAASTASTSTRLAPAASAISTSSRTSRRRAARDRFSSSAAKARRRSATAFLSIRSRARSLSIHHALSGRTASAMCVYANGHQNVPMMYLRRMNAHDFPWLRQGHKGRGVPGGICIRKGARKSPDDRPQTHEPE